jgi:hypothetical protein
MNEIILNGLNEVNASLFYGKEPLNYRIWISQNCQNFQNINSNFILNIFLLLYFHIYFIAVGNILNEWTWKSNYYESYMYKQLKFKLEIWNYKNKISLPIFNLLMNLNKWFFTFSPIEFNPFYAISRFLFIYLFIYSGIGLFIKI